MTNDLRDRIARVLFMSVDCSQYGDDEDGARKVADFVMAALDPAPEFPLPIRPDGTHAYTSCGCLHEDLILPDGRTGHEYCESETGACGTKIPATCKHCGANCACPNHRPAEESE